MKVSHTRPWLLYLWLRLIGLKPRPNSIYTFGGTVFTPGALTPDLVTHEAMHRKQQSEMGPWIIGPLRWWWSYRTPEFRLKNEVEAYAAQLRFCEDRMPRRMALRVLYALAEVLASPMYDVGLDEPRAMAAIQDERSAQARRDEGERKANRDKIKALAK